MCFFKVSALTYFVRMSDWLLAWCPPYSACSPLCATAADQAKQGRSTAERSLRDTGAAVQVLRLRGVRLCFAGMLAMIPETVGTEELATAISTEIDKSVFENSVGRSVGSWKIAWLVVVVCGGLALWCWMKIGIVKSTKTRSTQTMGRSRVVWLETTIETLKARCSEKGLGTSGTKEILTERLMKQRQTEEALSDLHEGV